jgi:hypothetical protein
MDDPDRFVDDYYYVNGADRGRDGRFATIPARVEYQYLRHAGSSDRWLRLAESVRTAGETIFKADLAEAIQEVADLRRLTDDLEEALVAYARSFRWSWRNIADALGVDVAAVHRRYAPPEVKRRRRSNRR